MKSTLNKKFLFFLIFLSLIGAYLIMKPFIVSILIAFVLSQMLKNNHQRILKKTGNKKELSSLISVFLVVFLIIIPIFIISFLGVKEVNSIYKELQANNTMGKLDTFSFSFFGFSLNNQSLKNFYQSDQFSAKAEGLGEFALKVAQKSYQGASNFIFMTIVMFFSLYYFFRDGEVLIKKMMHLSPLKNKQEELILERFISISRATLKGSLVISIIQAILIFTLFWATGVASPLLWGLATIIIALIPLVGAGLIWSIVGVTMLLIGNIWQGLTIILFGALVISTVDDFLRPILVGKDASLHPLLVFLSSLGGISLFGLIGFLIGPIVIALLVTLLDIYEIEFKKELTCFNKD